MSPPSLETGAYAAVDSPGQSRVSAATHGGRPRLGEGAARVPPLHRAEIALGLFDGHRWKLGRVARAFERWRLVRGCRHRVAARADAPGGSSGNLHVIRRDDRLDVLHAT